MALPIQAQLIPVSSSVSLHTILTTPAKTPPTNPAVVLLHFWGGSNHTYQPLITHLSRDFPIIVPSLRGWGTSSRPPDAEAYRTADYATDIIALLHTLSSDYPEVFANGVILVGHSMGAKIAQFMLTQKYQLPSFVRIKGLVLLAPAPAGSFSLPPEMKEQQVHAYDTAASAEFVARNVLLGTPGAVDDTIVEELVTDAIAGSKGARVAWPEYGMSEELGGEVARAVRDHREREGALRVLVVVGELDVVETVASVMERTVNELSASGATVEVHIIPGIGHLSPVEAPRVVADAIRSFLV
ncbi:hypothetical protein LTS09_017492 [Friedmanniomyces endolithicus]|nr:hypothetical protein LTS09_017492 [Friedmanniomyces endolithicus]